MKIVIEISATFAMKSVCKRRVHYINKKSAAATKLGFESSNFPFSLQKSVKQNLLGETITFFFYRTKVK